MRQIVHFVGLSHAYFKTIIQYSCIGRSYVYIRQYNDSAVEKNTLQ